MAKAEIMQVAHIPETRTTFFRIEGDASGRLLMFGPGMTLAQFAADCYERGRADQEAELTKDVMANLRQVPWGSMRHA